MLKKFEAHHVLPTRVVACAALGIVIVLAGCSDDDPLEPGDDGASAFDGVWDSGCTLDTDETDTEYNTSTLELNAGNFRASFATFTDAACSEAAGVGSEGDLSGVYVLGNPLTTDSGTAATAVDFSVETTVVEGFEIDGPFDGMTFPSLLQVDGDLLFVGTDVFEEEAVARPTTLDFSMPFRLRVDN